MSTAQTASSPSGEPRVERDFYRIGDTVGKEERTILERVRPQGPPRRRVP